MITNEILSKPLIVHGFPFGFLSVLWNSFLNNLYFLGYISRIYLNVITFPTQVFYQFLYKKYYV